MTAPTPPQGPYRARKAVDGWLVERELPCVNGLSAWFSVCAVDAPSDDEIGYSDGACGDAETNASLIAAALNRRAPTSGSSGVASWKPSEALIYAVNQWTDDNRPHPDEGYADTESEALIRFIVDRLPPAVLSRPAAQPAEDGWIAWSGGENPFGDDCETLVECKFGDGSQDVNEACIWDWVSKHSPIIAYRIAQPEPVAKPDDGAVERLGDSMWRSAAVCAEIARQAGCENQLWRDWERKTSDLAFILSSHEAQKADLAERDAEVSALTKALTGLTCGGSEFYIRKGERFVADIPACVAWVRRSKEDAHRRTVEAIHARKKADADLASQKAEIERLTGALEEARAIDAGFWKWLCERDLAPDGSDFDWADIVTALDGHETEICALNTGSQAHD